MVRGGESLTLGLKRKLTKRLTVSGNINRLSFRLKLGIKSQMLSNYTWLNYRKRSV